MKIVLLRVMLAGLSAVAVGSFLHILFPEAVYVPFFALAFSLTLVLLVGFIDALPSVILFGILVDLISSGRIGALSAFLVGVSYLGSFLSRRFVLEHGFSTHLFSTILVSGASMLFPFFSSLVSTGRIISGYPLSWSGALWVIFGSMVALALFRLGFEKFNSWTAYLDPQGIFQKR